MSRKTMILKFIVAVCVFELTACMGTARKNGVGTPSFGSSETAGTPSSAGSETAGIPQVEASMSETLEKLCGDIYENAINTGTVGDLEVVRAMVERLGSEGYVAVDQDSQINMEHSQVLEEFCDKVEQKQHGKVMFLMVLNNGGYVQFQMETDRGNVDVRTASLWWKQSGDGNTTGNWHLKNIGTDHYNAHTWVRSENGWLFFEKYYMAGFEGPYAHTAVRVEPLDETCREFNRKYLLPIGYRSNNLFITDWKEDDYCDVDFYDLYEILYRQKYSASVPYTSESAGVYFPISSEEFESVIRTHFHISREMLRQKIRYRASDDTYQYTPRGFYDNPGGSEAPYPEVTSCRFMEDETLELTVNAVWPEQNTDAAFSHTVVIRLLPDGSYQYVSNQVLSFDSDLPQSWYTKRAADAIAESSTWATVTFGKTERTSRQAGFA